MNLWRRILKWIGDIWMICGWYHLDIIQISPTYYPNITNISSIYYPHIIQISPTFTFHPNIIHISPTYRPNITRSIFFTSPQLDEKSSFNPNMARLLQKKTPLWNLIKTPLLIIQILPKYRPNIKNKPEIIQSTSIFKTPNLVKSRVFIYIWQVKTPLLNSIKTPLMEGKSRVLLDFSLSFCLMGWYSILSIFKYSNYSK